MAALVAPGAPVSVPITWDEWGIGAPSGGPAQVEDSGEIEFLLVFER